MKPHLINIILFLTIVLLLTSCTDKNSRDFHDAVYDGDLKKIEELVKNGTNPNILSADGNTPLYLATSLGNIKVIELLLKLGASVDGRNRKDDTTPIFAATSNGHLIIVKILVLNGADVNQTDNFGITLIDIAKTAKYNYIVEYLSNLQKKNN